MSNKMSDRLFEMSWHVMTCQPRNHYKHQIKPGNFIQEINPLILQSSNISLPSPLTTLTFPDILVSSLAVFSKSGYFRKNKIFTFFFPSFALKRWLNFRRSLIRFKPGPGPALPCPGNIIWFLCFYLPLSDGVSLPPLRPVECWATQFYSEKSSLLLRPFCILFFIFETLFVLRLETLILVLYPSIRENI